MDDIALQKIIDDYIDRLIPKSEPDRDRFKEIVFKYAVMLLRKSFQTSILTPKAFIETALGLISSIKSSIAFGDRKKYFYYSTVAIDLLFIIIYPAAYGKERELEKIRIEANKQQPVNIIGGFNEREKR